MLKTKGSAFNVDSRRTSHLNHVSIASEQICHLCFKHIFAGFKLPNLRTSRLIFQFNYLNQPATVFYPQVITNFNNGTRNKKRPKIERIYIVFMVAFDCKLYVFVSLAARVLLCRQGKLFVRVFSVLVHVLYSGGQFGHGTAAAQDSFLSESILQRKG